jgi:GntR family transcriptional regulator
MSLDEHSSRPLYRQVADALRDQIQQRELTPGHQLPTEARLMDRYGVSRNTVRLALGVLRTEGLVVTGQGRGSFVADVVVRRLPRAVGTREATIAGRGSETLARELTDVIDRERVEVRVATRPAPASVAERLGLRAGQRVVVRHRVHLTDDGPSHSSDTFASEELAADTPLVTPGPLDAPLAEVLAGHGHAVVRLADEVGVRMPTPHEAQELHIATGVPVLAVTRTVFDRDDAAVLTMTALLPGDRHVLHYDMAVNVRADDRALDTV